MVLSGFQPIGYPFLLFHLHRLNTFHMYSKILIIADSSLFYLHQADPVQCGIGYQVIGPVADNELDLT